MKSCWWRQCSKPTPSWQWNVTFNFFTFCRDHHLLLFPLFPIGCPSHSDHFSRDPTAEESVVKNEKHADRHIKLKKGNMPVYSFYIKFSYWNIMGNRNTLPFVVFKHQCNYAPLWNFILNSLGKHKAPVWIIIDNTQFTKNRKVMQGRILKISNLKQPSAFYGCSTFMGAEHL